MKKKRPDELDGSMTASKTMRKYALHRREKRTINCVPYEELEQERAKMQAQGWKCVRQVKRHTTYTLRFERKSHL